MFNFKTAFIVSVLSAVANSSPFPDGVQGNITSTFAKLNASPNGPLTGAGTLQGNYTDVLCSDDVVGDPTASPELRWSEADVDHAWTAVARFWNEDPASQALPFVQTVSHFWHGPEQWDCGKMGSDPCGAGPGSCGDKTGRGDTTIPAAWLILQSFTTIHNFQFNQYLAIGDAESSVVGEIGTFSSAFAPIQDKEASIKVLLDILGLGLAMVSSGLWNKILKDATIFNKPNDPNNHGFFKDIANAAISNSITIAKDKLSEAQSALEAQNELSAYVSQLIDSWRNVVATYTSDLFSGKAATLSDLFNQITSGKALNSAWGSTGLYDMESIMKKTLFGILIPKAWQESNTDVHPVILLPKDGATGCDGNPNHDFVGDDVSGRSGVCYNNQAFYLYNVAGGPCQNFKRDRPTLPCGSKILSELPGVGTLDGTAWGGVTRDDLVISAYQGYQINNNQNGYQMPELSNVIDGSNNQGELFFENGIQTPGLVTIPVCDFTTVARNWEKYGNRNKPDGYPCN